MRSFGAREVITKPDVEYILSRLLGCKPAFSSLVMRIQDNGEFSTLSKEFATQNFPLPSSKAFSMAVVRGAYLAKTSLKKFSLSNNFCQSL